MTWITLLLAVFKSLGASLGGPTGALIDQIVTTGATVAADTAAFEATIVPWLAWANVIADAKRDPTPEEKAAANALADAAHANVQSLGAGGPPVPLPAPAAV